MRATHWQRGLTSLAVLLIGLNARADDVIPFPAALDAAAVTVDRLDSVLDYARLDCGRRADSLSRRRVSTERWGRFGSNRPQVAACVCSALGQQSKSLGPRVEPDP